jgi:putative membrane protein
MSRLERMELTHKKKEVIRLILGFVFATKHYLRSEGGAEHADLQGLLPKSLAKFVWEGPPIDPDEVLELEDDGPSVSSSPPVMSPRSYSTTALQDRGDEERVVGLNLAPPSSPTRAKSNSFSFPPPSPVEARPKPIRRPVRRPTAVRVRPTITEKKSTTSSGNSSANERTPLIKSGVRSDLRRTHHDVDTQTSSLESAHRDKLGRMVEVGLPLIIAHEISRTLFRFRRNGNLESIRPRGELGIVGRVNSRASTP